MMLQTKLKLSNDLKLDFKMDLYTKDNGLEKTIRFTDLENFIMLMEANT